MKNILDQIVATKKKEVSDLKMRYTYKDFEKKQAFRSQTRSLKQALDRIEFGIIAEIKRKSPSAGSLRSNLAYDEMASSYQKLGASAISCLTDNTYFGGSAADLETARAAVDLPVLRKDFIIDEFQVLETKAMGADVILLICEILSTEQILQYTIMAQSLGLEVLLEFHQKDQLYKINDMVDLLGVNNRNLKEQKTDLQTSFDFSAYLPASVTRISESGVRTADEVRQLKAHGYSGALIGESLLRHEDLAAFLPQLTGA